MKSLTKSKIWLFAVGQFGWALLSGLIGTYLVNFYLPGDADIAAGQPILIPQGRVIFGFLTVIGLVTALGRLFDAVTDPLVASFSDKCKSKDGRRIPFIKAFAIPFAVATVLVFCAPFPTTETGKILNAVWLCVMVLAYYLFIFNASSAPPHSMTVPEYCPACFTWMLPASAAMRLPFRAPALRVAASEDPTATFALTR